jgi:molybdopterin molybdotransferase
MAKNQTSAASAGKGGAVCGDCRQVTGRERERAVSLEDALETILCSVEPLGSEEVSLVDAANRFLYEDVVSPVMIPAVDDSAMDGYAIIAEDSAHASVNRPVRLRLIGEVQAGSFAKGMRVTPGTAIRIMTGAPIPKGADSVVPFEDTEQEEGFVNIFGPATKYGNCKRAGENIKKGETVLKKGDRLKSADIGILAALNCSRVSVYRRPVVSIISTGNEVAEVGGKLKAGQIRNVNAYTLWAEVNKCDCFPRYLGIARDTASETRNILAAALESDVVISTGGVSMGLYDIVKEVYDELGIERAFEWVNIKPGRPFTFGRKGRKLIFGLPGYPVPTLTSFIQFVRPALLKMMGARRIAKPVVSAVVEESLTNLSGVVNLMRGHFTIRDSEFYVSTTGSQKSSMLSSLSKANCLIVVSPERTTIKAGEKVLIQLIDHDEV